MSGALSPDLQALFRRFGKAFNAGDIDGILGCVTPDFRWIMARGPEAPHGRIVTGRDALRAALQERGQELTGVRFSEAEVFAAGDMRRRHLPHDRDAPRRPCGRGFARLRHLYRARRADRFQGQLLEADHVGGLMVMRYLRVALVLLVLMAMPGTALAAQPRGAEARDMALVGFHDLQGRGAYQPVIHPQNGRWVAYVGHHAGNAINPLTGAREDNGTSLIDVTDPAKPVLLHHIPGGPGGEAQMVRVCSGRDLPRAARDRTLPAAHGRPLGARSLGCHAAGAAAAHCGGRGWPARHAQELVGVRYRHRVPRVGRAGLAHFAHDPGLRPRRSAQAGVYSRLRPAWPGAGGCRRRADRPAWSDFHRTRRQPRLLRPRHRRAAGILQIVDRDKLLQGPEGADTRLICCMPQVGRFDLDANYGAHTAFPVSGMEVTGADGRKTQRDFVVVTNEALATAAAEPRQKVWIIDVDRRSEAAGGIDLGAGRRVGDYCSRPGRIGAHSSHENFTPIYYRRIMFIAHFNAGVRALDIRDPYQPREIAYYVPASGGRTVTTNNVEVDDRGYIYIVDRHGLGMHILQLTGAARQVGEAALSDCYRPKALRSSFLLFTGGHQK